MSISSDIAGVSLTIGISLSATLIVYAVATESKMVFGMINRLTLGLLFKHYPISLLTRKGWNGFLEDLSDISGVECTPYDLYTTDLRAYVRVGDSRGSTTISVYFRPGNDVLRIADHYIIIPGKTYEQVLMESVEAALEFQRKELEKLAT